MSYFDSLTIEEQERAAYTAGDAHTAGLLARILHLENAAAEHHALLRDALDGEAGDADWRARATAAIAD